ncbi:biotin-dependent carboxyltransferase family protein [Vibrio comitans]|uniref:Allophanate hydrolase n=1 Tax=Vibrio comitans NBRC 102076 TaxID=1219078 RepID=A0A4Y3IJ86_9VIBR|nr:biotin-dependent carboxyltransferase family protein [Vibrio comitans]GEA59436.1 allophanate hydrolase [Vibrio comitans NBRC 102076]
MNKVLTLLKTNTLTSIQDNGRFGYAHLGITQGGAADEYSFHWANKLLENPFSSPTIETSLGGFEAEFQQGSWFAVTGALDNVYLDDIKVSNWSRVWAKRGQRLSVRMPRSGLRNYIALPSGVKAPLHHGSTSTVAKDRLGGLHRDGQGLKAGDDLYCVTPSPTQFRQVSVSPQFVPDFAPSSIIQLRLLPGSQYSLFDQNATQTLYKTIYSVSSQSNKMGYQLTGTPITTPLQHLISEPIAHGAVQVPPSGHPIVMLCERQTIGGYHKLGTVARLDLAKLSQAKPGTKIQFIATDANSCLREYKNWLKFFQIKAP